MKRANKYYIIGLAILALVAISCNTKKQEQIQQTGVLKISTLNVDTNVEVFGKSNTPNSVTKSSEAPHILNITITNKVSGEVVEYYENQTYMPSTVVLNVGSYNVEAKTANIDGQLPGDDSKVGFDQPRYYCSYDFEIREGQIETISLIAKRQTAGVSVAYSALFKDVYPCLREGETYQTTIFSSGSGSIVFSKGESRVAHFVVDSDDMTLEYQLSITRYNENDELTTYVGSRTSLPVEHLPAKIANYNLTIEILGQ